MKKLIYLSIFLFSATFCLGQSFEIVHPVTSIEGNAEDGVYIKVHVKNISSTVQNIYARREIVSLASGQQSYFCFGTGCYPPSVNLSPELVTLAVGAEDSSLKTYINAKGYLGTSIVSYKIFNELATDSIGITLTYNINKATLINHTEKLFVNAFPNPATDQLTLLYNAEQTYQSQELVITDVMGKVIDRLPVTSKEGNISVSTNNYTNGIYFCQLIADGNAIAFAKVSIQR